MLRTISEDKFKERLGSLFWASPYLVFIFFPTAEVFRIGITADGVILGVTLVVFVLFYLGSWLLNDYLPKENTITGSFIVSFGVLVFCYLVIFIIDLKNSLDISNTALLIYVISVVTFLSPRKLLSPLQGLTVGLATLSAIISQNLSNIFGLVILIIVLAQLSSVRRQSEQKTLEKIQLIQESRLSKEQERLRIASDLHDVLGQSLTAITIKADLANRLLDVGKTELAKQELQDLANLSRNSLMDMRQVVANIRTLSPDFEIESAKQLLHTAGVAHDIIINGQPAPGAISTLISYTIREACTNALRHARPSKVTIQLCANGVIITNDGLLDSSSGSTQGVLPNKKSSGTGLISLRERATGIANLTWHGEDDIWQVELKAK